MIDDALHRGLVLDRQSALVGESTAVFSHDRVYRYSLTRRWDVAAPLTCFVMCNPSTADAMDDDPTIRRCTGFAKTWGSGGLLVVNLFGLRATDPAELRRHDDPVGPDNDYVIHYLLDEQHNRQPIDRVVAAWGATGAIGHRPDEVTLLLACLGVTKAGHPRHPLYVPAATELAEFPQPEAVASAS